MDVSVMLWFDANSCAVDSLGIFFPDIKLGE